ncbi:hypothetical protein [Haloarcula marismortui]|uniref:Uncharacterized protein n=1 Tax=Haloarcula marismortui ATCC 33800 TaxID=662476 RepID=A0A8T8KDD3_9EURY|nr:hypothetical protein [Haloarcula sinaiiensis]QUJ71937.1 hypothetical protein KDQ40_14785 [Haloarcula sinaiiensis ATCC 33800]
MVDPDDIDLEQLVSGGSVSGISGGMDLEDVGRKVATEGSVSLDDQGRMLVKCSSHTSNHGCYVCGLHPMPDPESGDMKIVCTGPLMYVNDSDDVRRKSKSPGSKCVYSPERLEGGSGGWF